MCLITEQKTPLIAKKDIRVYKILKNDLSALFMDFKYVINEEYETTIEKSLDWSCLGILDYEYLTSKYGNSSLWRFQEELICLGSGFHTIKTKKNAKIVARELRSYKFFNCIIPKGSEYYIDAVGFLVSNKIKIIE